MGLRGIKLRGKGTMGREEVIWIDGRGRVEEEAATSGVEEWKSGGWLGAMAT
jgi:hypothetical protein